MSAHVFLFLTPILPNNHRKTRLDHSFLRPLRQTLTLRERFSALRVRTVPPGAAIWVERLGNV